MSWWIPIISIQKIMKRQLKHQVIISPVYWKSIKCIATNQTLCKCRGKLHIATPSLSLQFFSFICMNFTCLDSKSNSAVEISQTSMIALIDFNLELSFLQRGQIIQLNLSNRIHIPAGPRARAISASNTSSCFFNLWYYKHYKWGENKTFVCCYCH